MKKQESLGKTLASMDRQTTFLEWDGKQKSLEDFDSSLYYDPDDTDCSWEQVYKNNKVEY